MKEVLQAVRDYVQTAHTDYALLITGPWGCGKTYFWKNAVEPELRHLKADGAPWRPLYASFYGCQSTKDMDTQLFLACYPLLKKPWDSKLAKVGGDLLKQALKVYTRFEFPRVDLRCLINTHHAVLCFDDLERTRLCMKEALGYVNTFVEHECVKTIILTNEEAITHEGEKQIYTSMKEKVVGASLMFRPDLNTVLDTLIDEWKSRRAFHDFISQKAKLLRQLFDRSETCNVRSLRRAIAALAVIFDALHSVGVNPSDVGMQLVYAVAPAAFELHGRAADPARVRKILAMEHMALAGTSLLSRGSEKTSEEKYEEEFAERYLRELTWSEWGEAVGSQPICEFLLTGVLDRPALAAWAAKLTEPPDERAKQIEQLRLGFDEMEDDEFNQTATKVLNEVEAGEIAAISGYLDLYKTFDERFTELGLLRVTREELLRKFCDGLRKAQEIGKLEPSETLKDIIDLPEPPRTDNGRQLRELVLKVNKAALERRVSERVLALVDRRKEAVSSFLDALVQGGESGFLFTPVFQELDADDTVEWILSFTNTLKVRLRRALMERYVVRSPSPEFVVELPVLQQIGNELKMRNKASQKGRESMPVSLYNVSQIVDVLDKAIERLRQLKQSGKAAPSEPLEGERGKEKGTDEEDIALAEDPT